MTPLDGDGPGPAALVPVTGARAVPRSTRVTGTVPMTGGEPVVHRQRCGAREATARRGPREPTALAAVPFMRYARHCAAAEHAAQCRAGVGRWQARWGWWR